jgi:hypothetical protein
MNLKTGDWTAETVEERKWLWSPVRSPSETALSHWGFVQDLTNERCLIRGQTLRNSMLRSTVSRIRLSITLLGCAVLGASLFDWAQALRASEDGYTWVGLDSSSAPAIDTAEIWQTSASCERPFFIKAALRSKAKLNAHYEVAPEEIRARLNRQGRSESLQPPADQKGLYRLVNGEQDVHRRDAAQMEHDATLHVQYAEWYAAVSKLMIQESQWGQRLTDVADQRVILSEATRRGFRAYSGQDIGLATAKGDFDHYVLFLLGLGGFSSDEEQAIKQDCINVIPVKRIVKNASYLREIWRWPIDHVAAFALGMELVFVGVLFVPIVLWIGTGDSLIVKRHIGDAAKRLVMRVGTLHGSESLSRLLSTIRTIPVRVRGFVTAMMDHGPAEV